MKAAAQCSGVWVSYALVKFVHLQPLVYFYSYMTSDCGLGVLYEMDEVGFEASSSTESSFSVLDSSTPRRSIFSCARNPPHIEGLTLISPLLGVLLPHLVWTNGWENSGISWYTKQNDGYVWDQISQIEKVVSSNSVSSSPTSTDAASTVCM